MRDNILKDVYAQDKVELSAMDVELASVDDIQNKYSELYKKHFAKADSLISEAKKELRIFVNEIGLLEKEGVDIAKKAKDLSINSDLIPNYTATMKRLARDKGQAMEDITKTLAKYR